MVREKKEKTVPPDAQKNKLTTMFKPRAKLKRAASSASASAIWGENLLEDALSGRLDPQIPQPQTPDGEPPRSPSIPPGQRSLSPEQGEDSCEDSSDEEFRRCTASQKKRKQAEDAPQATSTDGATASSSGAIAPTGTSQAEPLEGGNVETEKIKKDNDTLQSFMDLIASMVAGIDTRDSGKLETLLCLNGPLDQKLFGSQQLNLDNVSEKLKGLRPANYCVEAKPIPAQKQKRLNALEKQLKMDTSIPGHQQEFFSGKIKRKILKTMSDMKICHASRLQTIGRIGRRKP